MVLITDDGVVNVFFTAEVGVIADDDLFPDVVFVVNIAIVVSLGTVNAEVFVAAVAFLLNVVAAVVNSAWIVEE